MDISLPGDSGRVHGASARLDSARSACERDPMSPPERAALPPPEATIRPVTDDAGRADYARIMTRAFALYGAPEASTAEHFARLAGLVGPTTQAYLAYRDGRALAGAVLYMAHGVGGIGWV